MSSRVALAALVTAILGTGASAIIRADARPAIEPVAAAPAPGANDAAHATELPAGHPKLGRRGPSTLAPPPVDEAPSLSWIAPSAWQVQTKPSAMRLATYVAPRAPGDLEDAELRIARAGGSIDDNVERWIGQFDDAGKDERTEKQVRGLRVTFVEVGGTYLGGGMPISEAAAKRKHWALLGAIVEGRGTPYFFKLTGPAATVRAARPAFEALIESVTPT
jgi:hypothetical protein